MDHEAVIFDLDGTLANTLEDIADAMNRALVAEKAPVHSYDEYRHLIGGGLRNLARESLPLEKRSEETISRCYEAMLADYGGNYLVKTRLYNEVPELVAGLKAKDVRLAVFSNKSLELTRRIVARLLDERDFAVVMGARAGYPLKPDPAVALWIGDRLGVVPERIAYVGDSRVDMLTAVAAGMIAVGAAWGFRTRDELIESGATVVIDHPLELLAWAEP